ncbi:MAG: NYN domain-containing protein [Actinomycetota bacterium]
MTRTAVPESLLTPLLDVAADVLLALAPDEIPPGLRTLAGFDRRGFAGATARVQLRRALDLDAEFRAATVAVFTRRPEVAAVLEAWTPTGAPEAAADAADRDDLALWTSALYAADPPGAEFGLGVACAEDRHRRGERSLADEVRAAGAKIATAEEARRRAESTLAEVRAELTRVDGELREQRRTRREREAEADERVEDAQRRAREAEATLDKARRAGELAEARAQREAERARDAERRLRERAREDAAPSPPPGPDPVAVADAARAARELATRLERLAAQPKGGPGAAPVPSPARAGGASGASSASGAGGASGAGDARGRRVAVPCPPGLRAEQPEAVEAMLRTEGLVLLVDGYNVSMLGWPAAALAQQRDHLVSELSRLHLRLRSHAIVVFDGSDVEGVPARRSPGVRVVFSPAGRPADPVIIETLREMPARVPVLVASSDHWVRDEAVRAGATVVPADALLAVLRR